IGALKRASGHLILGDIIVYGGYLGHGRDLTALNNVSLRLRARHCLKHEARNRQRFRGVKDSSLFTLRFGSRGDLNVSVTKDSLRDSLSVILKQCQREVDGVGVLHGRENVTAEHINIVRAALT